MKSKPDETFPLILCGTLFGAVITIILLGADYYTTWKTDDPIEVRNLSEVLRNYGLLLFGGVGLVLLVWRALSADRQVKASNSQVGQLIENKHFDQFKFGAELLESKSEALHVAGIATLDEVAEYQNYRDRVETMVANYVMNSPPEADKYEEGMDEYNYSQSFYMAVRAFERITKNTERNYIVTFRNKLIDFSYIGRNRNYRFENCAILNFGERSKFKIGDVYSVENFSRCRFYHCWFSDQNYQGRLLIEDCVNLRFESLDIKEIWVRDKIDTTNKLFTFYGCDVSKYQPSGHYELYFDYESLMDWVSMANLQTNHDKPDGAPCWYWADLPPNGIDSDKNDWEDVWRINPEFRELPGRNYPPTIDELAKWRLNK